MAIANLEQKIQIAKKNGYTDEQIRNFLKASGMKDSEIPAFGTTQQDSTLIESYTSGVKDAAVAGVQKLQSGIEQGSTAANPLQLVEGAAKVGAGAIETASSPLAPLFSPVGKLIGYVSDKIASLKPVQDFAMSPAGEATARAAELTGNLATIGGAVTGLKGAPAGVSNVGKAASATGKVVTGTAEAVGSGVSGIKNAITSGFEPAMIMQRVARINKSKQAKFQQLAGKPIGEYLVERGIYGDIDQISTQLFDTFQKSKAAADKGIEQIPGTFKYKPVTTALDELYSRETRVSSPGAKSRDFDRVRQLKQKNDTEGLTQPEINEVKRLFERNVKVDYLKTQKPEGVARATSIDTAIREFQRAEAKKAGFKNLQDINKETQLAKQLLDDIGAEYAGNLGNNAVSLTDWILLSGLDPVSIGAYVTKKGASSKSIQSAVAKKLAPEPTVGTPFPVFERGSKVIDNYADWIKSIEENTTK